MDVGISSHQNNRFFFGKIFAFKREKFSKNNYYRSDNPNNNLACRRRSIIN